jgi:site-specific recombinase XerD
LIDPPGVGLVAGVDLAAPRHFMATEMLDAGVPIVVVSRRLDHRRVSTTLDKYAHVVPGGDAHAAARIREIMQRSA